MRKMAVLLVLVACGSDAVLATVPDEGVDAAPSAVVDSGSDVTIADAGADVTLAQDAGHDAGEAALPFGAPCSPDADTCETLYNAQDGVTVDQTCWPDHTQGVVDMINHCTFRCAGSGVSPNDFCGRLDGGCGGPQPGLQEICLAH